MLRFPLLLTVGLLCVAGVPMAGSPAQTPQAQPSAPAGPSFTKEIRPLLKTYCFECHSAKKKKGGLDLEKFNTDTGPIEWPELWDAVKDRLVSNEMPPGKSPQPKEAERQKLLAYIDYVGRVQVSCDKLSKEQLEKSTAGYTMSRRLNRTEYNNTLRDLIGLNLRAGDVLPSEGGGGEGFDNTGGTLFTTPAHMEKYLQAAERVVATLLPAKDAKDAKDANGTNAKEVEAARKALLIAVPGDQLKPREAARMVLSKFMGRAFRRPVTDKELDRYLGLFDKATQRGDSYEQALRLVVKGVLISPNFIFLVEPAPEKEGPYRLGHYEMASHLSYFLWASMPDAELFELAAAGKLHDENVLRTQVRRMMRDPKSRGLAESFAIQWLDLRPLGPIILPDPKLFPDFDDDLAAAMRE